MRKLSLFALFAPLLFATIPTVESQAAATHPSTAIDRFVEQLYPKGSHYFWVVNATTHDTEREVVVDINTTLQPPPDTTTTDSSDTTGQFRFLLLLVDGELVAAHKIPLDAAVDCDQEEQV